MRFVRIILTAVTMFALTFLINTPKVSAAGADDGVNLHIMAEASNDNGATWHNYSGTESPGGETITANPGETIKLKIQVWNTDTDNATVITGTGAITNGDYISSGVVRSDDADHNGREYIGSFLPSSGDTGGLAQVNALGSKACNPNSGDECLTLAITLADSFPEGETIILGTFTITDYTSPRELIGYKGNLLNFMGRALAYGAGRNSIVRISVNVAAPTQLPATGPSGDIYLYFLGIIAAGVLAKTYQIVRRKIRV